MDIKTFLQSMARNINTFLGLLPDVEREIKEVEAWDGAASNYDTTADYCRASLINVNQEDDPDEWTQSHCKLPVREQGDASDVYVRQALGPAAGAIAGARTPLAKPDDVSEDEWDSAVRSAAVELLNAYEEAEMEAPASLYEAAGREVPEERAASFYRLGETVWELLYNQDLWLMDMFIDDNQETFAVAMQEGKLFRIPVTYANEEVMLGEPVQVTQEFPEVPRTHTTVSRQADGRYRWFSISCTATLNRSGEIDSRALFDKFIERFDDNPHPYRTFYHQGEVYRTGECDFVARDGYVLITSGLYDADNWLADLEIAARKNNPDYWGESIQFEPIDREIVEISGVAIPAYIDGVLVEISTLPEAEAAALFTTTQQREVKRMLEGKALDAFNKLAADAGMDEEQARQWLLDNPDTANRSIQEGRLIARSTEGEEETPTEEQPVEETPTEEQSEELREYLTGMQ